MEKVIKNMVCPRCVEAVEGIAKELNLPAEDVSIGQVRFSRKISEEEESELSARLQERGFELVMDRESELVSRVKAALISYVTHLEKSDNPQKASVYISGKLHYNYSYLSHVFAEKEGVTIESFLIKLKIEKVKELLSFKRYTLSEIAWKLKYSSVQYLSNQFKNVTGKTVSEYRKENPDSRISIDQL